MGIKYSTIHYTGIYACEYEENTDALKNSVPK